MRSKPWRILRELGDESVPTEHNIHDGDETVPLLPKGFPLRASQFGGSTITGSITWALYVQMIPRLDHSDLTTSSHDVAIPFYKRYAVRLLVVLWILSTASAMIAGFTVTNHALNEQLSRIRNGIAWTASSFAYWLMVINIIASRNLGEKASDDSGLRQLHRNCKSF